MDHKLAIEYMEKAACYQFERAHYWLACLHLTGEGGEVDYDAAREHLEACTSWHPKARVLWGMCDACEPGFGEGREWSFDGLIQREENETMDAAEFFWMGRYYVECEYNDMRAVEAFEKAAQMGSAEAKAELQKRAEC